MAPEEALIYEFQTQYIADELPAFTREFVEGVLPRWAHASAQSIAHATEREFDGCRRLLLELRSNRHHALIAKLNDASSMEWNVEDEDWRVFVTLLGYILRDLEALQHGAILPRGLRVHERKEGDHVYFVLDDAETGFQVYRVEEPVVQGSRLLVTYDSADPKQVPERAWRSISAALLRDFLRDRYRGRVEEVVYRQGDTGLSVSAPYG